MWFKKKSQIIGYNSNTAVDGTDWRTNQNQNNWSASSTLPSAADAGNYFYLPTLGFYGGGGQLVDLLYSGRYWSSSAYPQDSDRAYYLQLSSGRVYVGSLFRDHGLRVEPTFE